MSNEKAQCCGDLSCGTACEEVSLQIHCPNCFPSPENNTPCDKHRHLYELVNKAELTALRADAMRYRWLTSQRQLRISFYKPGADFDNDGFVSDLDSAIDAAMASALPQPGDSA